MPDGYFFVQIDNPGMKILLTAFDVLASGCVSFMY